jgi:TonB family protein
MLPPPAPSGGAAAPDPPTIKRKIPKKIPTQTVQPIVKASDLQAITTNIDDVGPGFGPGDPTDTGTCVGNCGETKQVTPVCGDSSLDAGEQCDDGNTVNGDGCSSTCRTEARPTPPARPSILPSTVLQGLRIAGETQIHPSTATRSMMMRANDLSVKAVILLCIAADGRVASATLQRSTRYDDYDQALLSEMHTWRYRPYTVNGAVVPACGIVNFNYSMK